MGSIKFLEQIKTLEAGATGFGLYAPTVGSRTILSDAPNGVFVTLTGAGSGNCDLPTTTTEVTDDAAFGGFLEMVVDRIANENGLEWAQGDTCRFIQEGFVVVVTEEAVTDMGEVFIRFATGGGGTQLGACRTDADTATAVAHSRARFHGDWPAGLALVQIR